MKVVVYNLGCKVNQYESDSILRQLEELGHTVSEALEYADIYILNTCAVTNEAERKSRQTIAKCNKLNPDAKIYVCGCASQHNAGNFSNKKNVKNIIGVAGKARLAESFQTEGVNIAELPKVYEDDFFTNKVRTRAYVKIQDGCNNFCAYCLIPYLRGRSRSRSPESIIKECENLAQNANEIVITGIDISSYGADINTSLAALLKRLRNLNVRIRLGSLEVSVIDKELLAETMRLKAFCPHFHLSLQSGCDTTLKAMNRRYSTAEYLHKVQIIRQFYPLAGITTDLICGFPTETEEEFAKTLNFIETVCFSDVHVFAYSKRDGTTAAKLEMLDKSIIQNRCKRAVEIADKNKKVFESKFIGRECEVLVENGGGYSREYIRVETPEMKENTILNIVPSALTRDGLK